MAAEVPLSATRAESGAASGVARRLAGHALVLSIVIHAFGCGSSSEDPSTEPPSEAGVDASEASTNPDTGICSPGGWCWEVPSPQGNDLLAVWAWSADEAIAVGERGTLLHFDGEAWTAADTPTTRTLRAVWGPSPNDVWAVGDSGNLLHFDGASWVLTSGSAKDVELGLDDGGLQPDASVDAGGIPTDVDLYGVHGLSASEIWVVGEAGTVAYYDGDVWEMQDSTVTRDILAVRAVDDEAVIAVGREVALEYNGTTWESFHPGVASAAWLSVHATQEEDVWLTGSDGASAHWDGTVWTSFELPGVARAVVAAGDSKAWAFGDEGAAFRWDGEVWTRLSSGTKQNMRGAVSTGSDEMLVVGDDGAIHAWDGTTRTSLSTGPLANWLALGGAGADDVWVVGDSVLRGTSTAWFEDPAPTARSLFGLWVSEDGETVWAVGTGGTVMTRRMTGWTALAKVTNEWLHAVWSSKTGAAWIVGANGTILGLLNETTWSPVPSDTTEDLHDVWGLDASSAWAVGASGTILRWDSTAWKRVPYASADAGTKVTLHGLWGVSGSEVWAVGGLGTIMRHDGENWAVAETGDAYTLHDIWGAADDDIWAVGTKGVILHYDGQAWTQQESGTTSDLFAVWGSGGDNVYVAGQGVILRRSGP